MGLFEAFEVDGEALAVPEDVTGKQPGRYPAKIQNVRKEEGTQKDNSPWLALVFEYKYDDDGFVVEEWFFLPTKPKSQWDYTTPLVNTKTNEVMTDRQTGLPITEGSQNDRLLGFIKKRLLAIGVPETRINAIDPLSGQLNDTEVVVTLVKNNKTGYTNIKKGSEGVVAKPTITQTLPGGSATPAAASSGALSAIKW